MGNGSGPSRVIAREASSAIGMQGLSNQGNPLGPESLRNSAPQKPVMLEQGTVESLRGRGEKSWLERRG